MKKLMIAAAVVLAAVTVNAATANWKISAAAVYDGTGSTLTTAKYSGTAYLFDAGKMAQKSLFEAWADGTKIGTGTTGYAASLTVANGALANTEVGYGEQSTAEQTNTYKFYLAIVEDDQMYFSQVLTKNANMTATAVTTAFGSQNASGRTSYAAPLGTGYQGEGQWSSVPEPTSALLMLLGVAGLALKRKQK